MALFKGRIRTPLIRDFAEQIVKLSDEAVLYMNQDGWHIIQVDPAHIMQIAIQISCKDFDEYRLPQDMVVGVDVQRFADFFKLYKNELADVYIYTRPEDRPAEIGPHTLAYPSERNSGIAILVSNLLRQMPLVDVEGMTLPKLLAFESDHEYEDVLYSRAEIDALLKLAKTPPADATTQIKQLRAEIKRLQHSPEETEEAANRIEKIEVRIKELRTEAKPSVPYTVAAYVSNRYKTDGGAYFPNESGIILLSSVNDVNRKLAHLRIPEQSQPGRTGLRGSIYGADYFQTLVQRLPKPVDRIKFKIGKVLPLIMEYTYNHGSWVRYILAPRIEEDEVYEPEYIDRLHALPSSNIILGKGGSALPYKSQGPQKWYPYPAEYEHYEVGRTKPQAIIVPDAEVDAFVLSTIDSAHPEHGMMLQHIRREAALKGISSEQVRQSINRLLGDKIREIREGVYLSGPVPPPAPEPEAPPVPESEQDVTLWSRFRSMPDVRDNWVVERSGKRHYIEQLKSELETREPTRVFRIVPRHQPPVEGTPQEAAPAPAPRYSWKVVAAADISPTGKVLKPALIEIVTPAGKRTLRETAGLAPLDKLLEMRRHWRERMISESQRDDAAIDWLDKYWPIPPSQKPTLHELRDGIKAPKSLDSEDIKAWAIYTIEQEGEADYQTLRNRIRAAYPGEAMADIILELERALSTAVSEGYIVETSLGQFKPIMPTEPTPEPPTPEPVKAPEPAPEPPKPTPPEALPPPPLVAAPKEIAEDIRRVKYEPITIRERKGVPIIRMAKDVEEEALRGIGERPPVEVVVEERSRLEERAKRIGKAIREALGTPETPEAKIDMAAAFFRSIYTEAYSPETQKKLENVDKIIKEIREKTPAFYDERRALGMTQMEIADEYRKYYSS